MVHFPSRISSSACWVKSSPLIVAECRPRLPPCPYPEQLRASIVPGENGGLRTRQLGQTRTDPPAMSSVVPLIHDDWSDARKRAA